MARKLLTFFFLVMLVSNNSFGQVLSQFLPKEKSEKTQPIIVNGDTVNYSQQDKIIVGQGNVSVKYGEITLTCDKITVDTTTKIGYCEGSVKITRPGQELTGEKIEYNFPEETGKIDKGELKVDSMYSSAGTSEKDSKDHYILSNASLSTCDHDMPHYRIVAKEIQVFVNDKVIAKHVFFYIGNVPVFYIPYYVMPIKQSRNVIDVVPGYKDNWGYYLLGSYRYYIGEKIRGDIRLDYRTKRGLGYGADAHYDADKLGKGMIRYYYTHENGGLAIAPPEGEKKKSRYRFEYRHKIDLAEDTVGLVELNKVSDADVVKDYFDIEVDDGWTPENYLSIITNKENYSTNITMDFRLNDFLTKVERLPEITMDVYNQSLWGTRFYYTNQISLSNFRKTYASDLHRGADKNVRFDTYNKLSYVAKLFNFLNVTPYLGMRYTYFAQNISGKRNDFRQIYEYGVNVETKFFRTFDVESEKFNIHKLRHVITPRINYFYRQEPTVDKETLIQFDAIDAMDYSNVITLELENKLQTKRKRDNGYENVDLIRLIIGTNYTFYSKDDTLGEEGRGEFGDVDFNLELRPFDWMFAKSDITFDFSREKVSSPIKYAVNDLICNFGKNWNVGIGYIYENNGGDPASQFTLQSTYKLNNVWSFRVYERFDVYENRWQEQEYTVFKDLHCWLGEFCLNIQEKDEGTTEYAFWAVFRLKAFPELPFGFSRTYKRPSPGDMAVS
ncbi:MAG: LptA/OstA family protein [Candidatus Omnitrophica bacterium]|nr:LptA/OstA family protein [Candidatus Omnitrophota bacterium]